MMGLEKWIVQMVYPFMKKIGLRWMTDHVLPAQEHFSSHLVQKKIIVATDQLPAAKTNSKERFLLFTPEKEEHEIPLLIANYLLKKQGFRTILFGKNVSLASVQYYCEHHPVSHLYFHLITNFTDCETDAYLRKLSKLFPGKKIIAAGSFIKNVSAHLPGNIKLIHSVEEIMYVAQKEKFEYLLWL
jgi:MerR family transcriptional regulator, light-induced transcriptional regulator